MYEIIFFFGAGASFGAGSILPERPPLGGQLYYALSSVYPGSWGSLPSPIRTIFIEEGFEVGMGMIYSQLGSAIPALMREMALYFIQFRPIENRSLYCNLIKDLKKLGKMNVSLFSTINYECVLEFSLSTNGYKTNYFGDDEDGVIPVWKLHGSCNFFSSSIQASKGVSYGTGVIWEGGIRAISDPNQVIKHCLVETGLSPIMSLYMKGKPLAVSPNSVEKINKIWSERVQESSVIFSIGAKPWPDDDHVWGPLAEASATLYLVCGEGDYSGWVSNFRSGPTEYLGNRFNLSYNKILKRISEL